MNKICTSIEQSQKLIELGIGVKTADMFYRDNGVDVKLMWEHLPDVQVTNPAWSLTALLDLMPKVISIMVSEHAAYRYELEWQFANDNSLRYVGNDGKCLIDIYSDHDDGWKDSIDTAFEMICWLKENGKI